MPCLLRPFGLAAALIAVPFVAAPPALAQDEASGAYLAARAADRAGDYAAMVEYGTRALIADPENIGLLEGLVMAEIGLGQIGAAVLGKAPFAKGALRIPIHIR